MGWLSTMTAEERLLIHLLSNPLPERAWDVQKDLTQAGISDSTYIQRKHVPRTIKLAIKRDLVDDTTRHVIGGKQRRKVYFLTTEGFRVAEKLKTRLISMTINKDGEHLSLEDLVAGQKILHILSHIDEQCKWNVEPLCKPIPTIEKNVAAEQIFTAVMGEAWRDGKISEDEKSLITTLSKVLNFPSDDLERISKEAEKSNNQGVNEAHTIYLDIIIETLSDGRLPKKDVPLLSNLRSTLGLSDSKHDEILEEARNELGLESEGDSNTLAYADALRVALADQVITSDEEEILKSMRKSLNISEAQHLSILAIERAKLN